MALAAGPSALGTWNPAGFRAPCKAGQTQSQLLIRVRQSYASRLPTSHSTRPGRHQAEYLMHLLERAWTKSTLTGCVFSRTLLQQHRGGQYTLHVFERGGND